MRTKNLWIIGLVMLVTLLACAAPSQIPPTVVLQVPTGMPTTPPTLAPTVPPTSEPTAAVPTEAPTIDGTGGGGVDNVVLLTDFQTNPTTIVVADAITGETQSTFTASGLTQISSPRVGGPFVYFLNPDTQKVNRVGFDGTTTELPFISSGGQTFDGDYLPSPDGTMIAWGTSTFDTSTGSDTHITLKVAYMDGSDEKTIVDEFLKDTSILPQPIQWSPDGRYFYYTNIPYGIGGYILFSGGPDLHRVDIETGEVTDILPDIGCLCAMTVSPDGKTVAYIPGSGTLNLVLHDIETGAERSTEIDPGHLQAGNILWSADGKTLVYTMAVSNYENPEEEQYAIVRVDAASLTQTVIVPDNTSLFNAVVWPFNGPLWAVDKDNNSWLINPETGEMIEVQSGKRVIDN